MEFQPAEGGFDFDGFLPFVVLGEIHDDRAFGCECWRILRFMKNAGRSGPHFVVW